MSAPINPQKSLDQTLVNETPLNDETKKNILAWLCDSIDNETKEEIRRLLREDPEALKEGFCGALKFGTGGVRAPMGIGSARLNRTTIAFITQGLANFLKKRFENNKEEPSLSVVIGFDCRHNSQIFADEISKILAGNNIKAYVLKELRPTPFISFLCRHKKASAAINITASHNPKEYSGYKVYSADGAQITSPDDSEIIKEVERINSMQSVTKAKANSPLICSIGSEYDSDYLKATHSLQLQPEQNKNKGSELNVIYSPLHGAGITLVPRLLADWGFKSDSLVESQMTPDGDFPNAPKPNPEETAAMRSGLDQLKKENADLFIATDPDADRLGVATLHKGASVCLSGNEMACIFLHYILEQLSKQNRMPKKPACVKTIVTTELFARIANHFNTSVVDTLTGFKYIGEKIHEWEKAADSPDFIFGAEESYGCLFGTHARDKDALVAAGLGCEIALDAKLQGKTLVDKLYLIFERFGLYRQKLHSIDFEPGLESQEKIKAILTNLRTSYPKEIDGHKVIAVEDYEKSERLDVVSGKMDKILLPKSNVLAYRLENEGKLTIRGSGTEPKLKLYAELKGNVGADMEVSIGACDQKLARLIETFEKKHTTK